MIMGHKAICFLVSIALFLGLLVLPAAAATTIDFWYTPWDPDPIAAKMYFDNLFSRFEKETGVKVRMTVVPWAEVYRKWTTAIESGTVPDLSTGGTEAGIQFASKGALEPLDDVIEWLGGPNQYYSTLCWYKWNGHYWLVPYIEGAWVLMYRKDLFAKAGINSPPQTWDELLTKAQKLTKDLNGDGKSDQWGIALPYNDSYATNQALLSFIASSKAREIGEDGHPAINTPEMKKVVQFYVDLYMKYRVVPPGVEGGAGTNPVEPIYGNGEAAMMMSYGWLGSLYSQQYPDVFKNTGYGVIPHTLGAVSGSYGATGGIWLFSKAPHKKEAKELLKFMMRDDNLTGWIKMCGWLSPVKRLNTPEILKMQPWNKSIVNLLEAGRVVRNGVGYGAHPANGEVEGRYILSKMILDIVNGMSLYKALDKYQRIYEDIFAKY
ncbi:MAG: sugar ABC transporter substrate-binding protein [Firmicutes bacterium]|nr:sugar ABC transporter substrate-binding protein [Bacillota bacterium]